ncbi:DMT family transporter [Neisseria zalophi]|uniref:DMT family transporter n=1 Tax=Neisseria zalophi TaxID=640030 RepID=A0A5J6PW10_9NEIS|nr:DMT family transporter [Neisseria zalophi]QEY26755.1 DMT family transporter [Neisseria zalophi]
MSDLIKGLIFATAAAALNASIGIFSKILIEEGLNIQDIAFFKTFAAFLLLSLMLIRKPFAEQKRSITDTAAYSAGRFWGSVALCAFLGIFVLFFFETAAYRYGNAADVVAVLMASAAVSALVFGRILLGESIAWTALLGTAAAVVGIGIIAWSEGATGGNIRLVGNAALAGTGYGVFSVMVKKTGLKGGLFLTRLLMLFGSLFLLLPFLNMMHPIDWNGKIVLSVLALALLPTVLGFYCTTKALGLMSAANVQVTELSEPLFAAFLAWLVLSEMPSAAFLAGAVCIVAGIVLMNGLYPANFRKFKNI